MQANNYSMYPNLQPVDPATGLPYTLPSNPTANPGQPYCQHGGYPYQQGSLTPTPYAGIPCSVPCSPPSVIEWVRIHPMDAGCLTGRAVVAGGEGHDGTPLWVIRAQYRGDLIPGKLAILHHAAFVPFGGQEHTVDDIEVCCAPAERVRWYPSGDGRLLPNAVVGGRTSDGEPLYIGRVHHERSLTPGKVHPSQGVLYISFAGREISYREYDVLCTV